MYLKVNKSELNRLSNYLDNDVQELEELIKKSLHSIELIQKYYNSSESIDILEKYYLYLEKVNDIPKTINEINIVIKKANNSYTENNELMKQKINNINSVISENIKKVNQ